MSTPTATAAPAPLAIETAGRHTTSAVATHVLAAAIIVPFLARQTGR